MIKKRACFVSTVHAILIEKDVFLMTDEGIVEREVHYGVCQFWKSRG